MSILSDRTIEQLCTSGILSPVYNSFKERILGRGIYPLTEEGEYQPMIEPFVGQQVDHLFNKARRIPSYGLSSAGYDIRLDTTFRLFSRPQDGRVIDILNYNEDMFSECFEVDEYVNIPPGGLLLGVSVEYFRIPRQIIATCVGKSSWARLGSLVNVTPLEPGWRGHLVVEITNGSNFPLRIYPKVGIAQVIFHRIDQSPMITYDSRRGKYQNQNHLETLKL